MEECQHGKDLELWCRECVAKREAAARREGREEERRDVVAWLRGTRGAGVAYAREIEAGEHIGAAAKEGKE